MQARPCKNASMQTCDTKESARRGQDARVWYVYQVQQDIGEPFCAE